MLRRTPASALPSLFVLFILLAPGFARAASITIVPPDTSVTIGDTFTLRVMCGSIADLKGFQVAHAYTPSRLQLLAIPAGDMLTGGGGAWVAYPLPDVSAPADSAWLDAAKLDGSMTGPGILAYYRFKATTEGTATLTCLYADFRDSNNADTIPTCAGSVVHILGPVPAGRRSWGRLKSAYR